MAARRGAGLLGGGSGERGPRGRRQRDGLLLSPAAFILAGGRSRRFGVDKARFPVEGVPMALRVAASMRAAGLAPVLVVRDRGLADLGLPLLLEDPAGPLHPLNGIVAGLAAAPGGAIFAPCDVPWLPPRALERLLEGGPAPRVAIDPSGLHPLLAFYPGAWLARATALRDAGRPVRALAEGAERVSLQTEWLKNINRREDLR